jgi:hypothetical protein
MIDGHGASGEIADVALIADIARDRENSTPQGDELTLMQKPQPSHATPPSV